MVLASAGEGIPRRNLASSSGAGWYSLMVLFIRLS
jgi:uncharacterized membrane protein YbjE (DUF340 family)